MARESRHWFRAIAMAAVAALVVACGADDPMADTSSGTSDTTAEEAGGEDTAQEAPANVETVEDVFAAVEGLEGSEREDALRELAEGEGDFTWYTSLSDNEDYVAAFEDRYGITVNVYRGKVDEVRERVLEEDAAGQPTMDTVNMNDRGMYQLDEEGMFAPLLSPTIDLLPEERVADNWVWGQQLVLIAGWNTDLVEDPPSTWEELLTDYAGELALEPRSYYWMGSLVEQHFVEELGYTEEEAVQLFKDAAKGSRAVQGNPTLFQYVVAGEIPITAHSYNTYFQEPIEQGAPIAWQPPIEPIPTGGHGLAINRDAPNPATAVLWFEWFLTDGQEVVASRGTWPANPEYATGESEAYETVTFGEDIIMDPEGKWKNLYDEVIAQVSETIERS